MASEVEVRLNKEITQLRREVNTLRVDLRKLYRVTTHPSTRAYIEKLGVVSGTLGDLLGTTNRIIVTNGASAIAKPSNVTLNTPQDIHTGATPTFLSLILTALLTMTVTSTPGSAPANSTQTWVEDINGVGGYAGLHKMTETTATKEVIPGVVIKTTTGHIANPYESLMEINTFDNTFCVYADAAWRTLASGW